MDKMPPFSTLFINPLFFHSFSPLMEIPILARSNTPSFSIEIDGTFTEGQQWAQLSTMDQQQKYCVLQFSIIMAIAAFVSAYAMYQYLEHFIHVLLVNWWKPYVTNFISPFHILIHIFYSIKQYCYAFDEHVFVVQNR